MIIEEKNNKTLVSGMIILLVYQIFYAVLPGLYISIIKAQYEENLFVTYFFKDFFASFTAIAIGIIGVIIISIGLKEISNEKNQKIKVARILSIALIINPFIIDLILEQTVAPEYYNLTIGIFLRDLTCILNGVIFITLMVLLRLIQKEFLKKRSIKIREMILPTISIGLLVVWYIITIYKQVKMNPVPEGLGFYDYYFDKIRISSNVIHILFAIIGFIMILEFVIKDLIERSKINIKGL